MRGKSKSIFKVSMIMLLSLSFILTGCGNGNNDAKPVTDATTTDKTEVVEPFDVTVYINEPGQQPTPDNKIYKMMKEKLGVTFKFEFLAGDSNQKLGVMIAGEDYPDLLTGGSKLTDAGAFIPLEELIEEHAPNLKAHYADYWNQMKDPDDGHIYMLPNYGAYTGNFNVNWYSGPAFWIQKAVLEEFDFPKVTTLDQYFDLIAKYKEKYPTIDGAPTSGFEILNYDWRNWSLFNAPQHLIGHPNDGGVVVKDGVAEIHADKDYAKKYFKKLNEMNNIGLINKETFVQNYDQYLAKVSSGTVLGMFDQHWNFSSAEESLQTQGKDERTYIGLPLVFDEGTKEYYRDLQPINLNNGFGISVNAKDPVKIIKLFDELISEEWQTILSWGIEGEDYFVNAEGRYERTEEQRVASVDATWQLSNKAKALYANMPKFEGTFSNGNASDPAGQSEEFYASLKPYDKKVLDAYGYKTFVDFFTAPPANPVYYPAWQIDLIEGSEAKISDTQRNAVSTKYLPKAILSSPNEFEDVWSEYTSEIGKANIPAYEKRMNEQIQWRIKNWSK
ncbi:type 2 periplasmic-binding domain-containing protein [Paenibacillus sp. CMAA1364]